VKTYLTIWFDSEGAGPREVIERLRSLGFKPLKGYHDHVYDWGRKVELEDVIQLASAVHEVLYTIETE